MKNFRLVVVPVSVELLPHLFCETRPGVAIRCVSDLPADAQLLNVRHTDDGRTVEFVFTHTTFAEVAIGQQAPRVVPQYAEFHL